MNIQFDPRVNKWLATLSNKDKADISEYLKLFVEYGFNLSRKYLKKIDNNLWELRPKTARLFFITIKPQCIIIHGMMKKSQKITKETWKILKQRKREYI